MADKNIQMTQRNTANNGWDNLYPKTKAFNVNFSDDTDLETYKTVIPTKTTADITYYVATTGSDSNNGTSSSTPFKTIAKAISMIPQIVNHAITIIVTVGTYNEPILLKGYIGGGSITIKSSVDATIGNVSVTYVRVDYCSIYISILGINATSYVAGGGSFTIMYSKYVVFKYCSSTFTASVSGLYCVCCDVVGCAYSTISNKNTAVYGSLGVIELINVTGTGNTTGISAMDFCNILKNAGTNITATTATATTTGGTIISY